jgi:hypothetical protein
VSIYLVRNLSVKGTVMRTGALEFAEEEGEGHTVLLCLILPDSLVYELYSEAVYE